MDKNKMHFYKLSKLIVVLLVFFVGCSTSPKIEKTEIAQKPIVIWDTSDSEHMADSLISELLSSDWASKISKKRKPIIVVGKLNSYSIDSIDIKTLEKNLERSLVNSGEVSFISSKEKREEIRYDRRNSLDFEDSKSFNQYLKSLKSDFFLQGNFRVTIDSANTSVRKTYIMEVELLNARDTKIVWKGTNSISK